MRLVLLFAAVAVAAAAVTPGAAAAKRYDVPAVMGDKLTALVEETPIGVLLPQSMPFDYAGPLYASVEARERSWEVVLAGDPDCNGANACTLAWLSAREGARHGNRVRVRLTGGRTGWYRARSCGGSCSPPSIEFVRAGVLYEIQGKVYDRRRGDRATLVTAANSALRAGLRSRGRVRPGESRS